ncbi:hypothetical protein HID58_003504 [Brassica napus]|uniref:Uncharacterized protein n=1 Tax=Brassica napus TaxID=3708 RepID=A0ABQ8ERF1_BRANA|nr:hypothetical protein HID58_003504 [Brassica napus]
MTNRVHWIDKSKLVKFILDCQPSLSFRCNLNKIWRMDLTMLLISFTLTLELQGWSILESNQIDPAYALPVDVINRILLTK